MPVAAAPVLTATALTTGNATISLGWTNIATNTGYTISMSPGSLINLSSNVVSYVTPTLSSGVTYSFQIATLNSSGLGLYSTPAKTAIPYVAPSAVASFSVNPSNLSNVLVWTAPSNNGGNAVTGYKWFRSQLADMSVIDASLAVAAVLTSANTGLTNGSAYYYYIQALNLAGYGISSQIVSGTPRAVPSTMVLSNTPSNQQVTLSWAVPLSNGAAITSYNLNYSTTATTGPWTSLSSGMLASPYVLTGLNNGSSYYFQIAASNAAGFGTYSATSTAVPYTIPFAPASLTATPGNANNAVLAWTAPSSNGGSAITGYKWIRSQLSDMSVIDVSYGPSNVLTNTNTGLISGTTYYYQVQASNLAGLGPFTSAASAVARTIPSTMVLSNTPSNQQVTLSWAVPLSNGAAITSYNLNYSTTATTGPWTSLSSGMLASPYVLTGLNNGSSYYFQIAASNAAGFGTYSATSTAVPYTIPFAPASLTATPGNANNAVLAWTAPSSNGGSAITGYKWIRSQLSDMSVIDASYGPSNVLTNTNTGLINGTTYYYQVQANNAAGLGTPTSIVSSMPRTIPGTSSISVVVASPSNFTISFSATSGGSSNTYILTPYSNAVAQSTLTFSGSPVSYSYAALSGPAYTFKVQGSNVAGLGTASAVTSATFGYNSAGAFGGPSGNTYWFYPTSAVTTAAVAYNLAYADVSISQLSNAVWSISYGGVSDTLSYVRNISLADRKVWFMDASYSSTGGSYLTIATNNTSLSNGDVIRVGSGVYLANTEPTINKSITIEGPPDGSAVFGVAPGVSTWCLTIATDNVNVRNLTLDTGYALSTAVKGDFSLLVGSTAATVSGTANVVRELSNILIENMQFKNSYTTSGTAASFNRWDNRRGVAINSVSGLILRNSTFPKTWEFGLTLASCRNAVVTGNTFYACGGGSVSVTRTNQKMIRFILSNDLTEYETNNIDLTGNTFLDFGDLSLTTIVPTPSGGWSSLKTLQNPIITIQPSLGYTITHSSNPGSNVRMPPEYAVSYTLSQYAYFGEDATDLPSTFWADATAVNVMSNNVRIFPPGYASAALLTPSLLSVVGQYVQGSVLVNVSSAIPGVTYAFSLDSSLAGSNTTGVYDFTALSEGQHSVAVTGTDGYTTSPATTLTFISDTILPTISGFMLVTGPTLSGEIVVSFDASDANGPLSYTTFLNDVSFADNTPSPDTIQLPGWNTYDVKVKVADAAGNVGTSSSITIDYWPTITDVVTLLEDQAEQKVTIDGSVIEVPIVDPADIEDGTSEPPASGDPMFVREEDGTGTLGLYTPDVVADIESTLADALALGVDTLFVGLEDSQGVVTLHEAAYTEENSVQLSNGSVEVHADTSQVVGWLSTPPAEDPVTGDIMLYYRVLDGDGKIVPDGFSVPIWITKHDVIGPSIGIWHRDDAAVTYTYLGVAMRVAASESTTIVETGSDVFYYELTFNDQVSARDPTAPDPPINLSVSDITAHTATISWSAPTYDGGAPIVRYEIMNMGFVLQTSTSTSASLSGLSHSTSYTLSVRAVNAIGTSENSENVTFTTLPSVAILSGPTYSEPRTLSVVAAGSGLTYQWYKNNIAITSGSGGYTGATSNRLVMKGSRDMFIGSHWVVVAADDGATTTSSAYSMTSATGSADPYISTLDGKLYKLPSFNGHLRLYQGMVGGHLLTINATTRIDDNKAAMDADTADMNSRLAKPVQKDLRMSEAMSFFERIHMNYAGETMVVNVYDGFKVEKSASWPVEVVGNVQKFLKAFSFYEDLAGDIIEISPCPEAVLRIGIVPIRSIRNSVELIAPNMAAGNGAFVHRLSRKQMTLRKLSDVKPVERKDAIVKRTICETFVCDAKTAVVNIPYVG